MSGIPPYKHRKNNETSFDSICTTCYRTIGKRETEAELEQDEKSHACRPGHSYAGVFPTERTEN
jgi:hypothetical protein